MNIRIPPFLKDRDTIGITAPSFGCTIEPYASKFKTAKKILEGRGYAVKAGDTVFKSDGKGISTSPEVCARELEEFYGDETVNAIISAGGGEMMCETAGFIDFDRLGKLPPKWFMGYSDNTNFIFPLVTIAKTAAIYGPCISGFGKKWEESESDSFGILEGKKNSVRGYEKFQRPEDDITPDGNLEDCTYNLTQKKILSSYVFRNNSMEKAGNSTKIELKGILLGGCLDVLATICGTNLDRMKEFNGELDDEKIIWVLESCDGNPMEIRRQIWHLKNCGWFDKACGFLIGRPLASFGQEMMGVNQYNAVTDILTPLKVPVIMDCDIGHIDPAVPVVIGAKAKIMACGNSIEFFYGWNSGELE